MGACTGRFADAPIVTQRACVLDDNCATCVSTCALLNDNPWSMVSGKRMGLVLNVFRFAYHDNCARPGVSLHVDTRSAATHRTSCVPMCQLTIAQGMTRAGCKSNATGDAHTCAGFCKDRTLRAMLATVVSTLSGRRRCQKKVPI